MIIISISIFSLLLIHYLIFIFKIYRGLFKLKSLKEFNNIEEFISVIIPFRNESALILRSLKSLEMQNYSPVKFEVIYINDFSEDDSYQILQRGIKRTNFKLLNLPESVASRGHKKRAIKYGIDNAAGSIIITTDADCVHGPHWLKSMTGNFDSDTAFVAGPVALDYKPDLFSRLQQLEFAGLILSGAGLIGINKPVLCNAANLGFRKEIYEEIGGYEDNYDLSSGDDEFLMQKIAKNTDYKIKFCINKDAIVKTPPAKSFENFFQQRKRWASKGFFYKNKLLILELILIYLFYVGLGVQLITGIIISPIFLLGFLFSLSMKSFIEYLVVKQGKGILFDSKNFKLFPIAELFHIPYIIVSGIAGILGNYTWKERKLKR